MTSSDNNSPTQSSYRGSSGIISGGGTSVGALTRSSSVGSISSIVTDDLQSVKSSYTSAASSCLNGIMTPAYSELPDSPGGSPVKNQNHQAYQQPQQQQQQPNQFVYATFPVAANFDPQFPGSYLICNR